MPIKLEAKGTASRFGLSFESLQKGIFWELAGERPWRPMMPGRPVHRVAQSSFYLI